LNQNVNENNNEHEIHNDDSVISPFMEEKLKKLKTVHISYLVTEDEVCLVCL
jgi:hypothetical protein